MEPTRTPITKRDSQGHELSIKPGAGNPADGTVVLRIQGPISAETSRALDHYLRARLPPEYTHVALDLSATTLLTAAGVRVLTEHARRLVARGRRFSLVAPNSHVMGILNLTSASSVVKVYDTVSLAIVDARKSAPAVAGEPGPAAARSAGPEHVLGLRMALHTKPAITQAAGLLQGRYGLGENQAFQLLGDSAQRHGLTVHHLAQAVLATPAPGRGAEWFPGRRRRPEPFVTFCARPPGDRGDHAAMMAAFFSTVLRYFATARGALHLTEASGRPMWLDRRQGLSARVAYHLVEPHRDCQPVALALTGRRRVIVTDILAYTSIPVAARSVLADSGLRAMHSTPMVSAGGECFGAITAFHTEPGHEPTGIQCAKTDHAAAEVAEWLAWHRETLVKDALEDLHSGG
ncbi:STAS domain-containing protein [Actinocrispum sp. NPDC049592]|uniref:STAS domain-containing protein n=1 Tax=Actinocrispum sp. NPDC049592 TaxID=3154835 RepID=UPI0034249B40